MRELSVTEFKSQLSRVLREVQKGESFLIVYGKERRPVAQIVPVKESMKKEERTIRQRKVNSFGDP